ncbi:HAD family hydrolase [Bifidobacterium aquikefiri]|uniref:HAD family hydrolase n=1 Tax=Bifidobacterium aquikefiri TaxID=1653207 RepID=UPI0023F1A2DB|nr:HAD family phosphatase [Bifidobacterium aquikefiri]
MPEPIESPNAPKDIVTADLVAPNVITAQGPAEQASGLPITDVVFDFGNVLVYWQPSAALVSRYSPETINHFLDNKVSGFFDANDFLDGGESAEDVTAWMERTHGHENAEIFRFYLDHFEDSLTGVVPGARMLIEDLKAAGIGVWGLSNWERTMFPIAWEQFGILHMLQDKVISGNVHMRKPHRDIFELAIRQFGIDSRASLFIDDKSQNVLGANASGMRAFQFSDSYKLRNALIAAGVNIPSVQ